MTLRQALNATMEDPDLKVYRIKINGKGGIRVDTYMASTSLSVAWGAVADTVLALERKDLMDDGSEEV